MIVLTITPQTASSIRTTIYRLAATTTSSHTPMMLSRTFCIRSSQLLSRPAVGVISSRQFSTGMISQFNMFSSRRSKDGGNGEEKLGKVEKVPEEVKIYTEPAWPHPVYTQKQMMDIKIAHRETKNWSDWVALTAVRLLRWGFDKASGYKHDHQMAIGNKSPRENPTGQVFKMTPERWLIRFIFLESVAGVPGMVGGMVRHLHSLRKLRRDHGWIETLLEEAYNERMHLLTFLKLRKPGWFMRLMILGAQGVFFNGFFVSYLISPRTCHRFVGYLEEEAVITYTRAIADIEAGKIPEWNNLPAPEIAINYWKMDENATIKDLLCYVRADEAKHREVNHTLANLAQEGDPNPFLAKYENPSLPHPAKGLDYIKSTGWEREEVLKEVKTRAGPMPM